MRRGIRTLLLVAGAVLVLGGPGRAIAQSARVELDIGGVQKLETDARGRAEVRFDDTPGPLRLVVRPSGRWARVQMIIVKREGEVTVYEDRVRQGEWVSFEPSKAFSRFLAGYHGLVRFRINGPSS